MLMEDRNNYGQVGFTHTPGCSGQIGEERPEASQLYHHQYAPGRGADILEFMRRALRRKHTTAGAGIDLVPIHFQKVLSFDDVEGLIFAPCR